MKDEIVGSSGDTGRMWGEIVAFSIGCIPVILCIACFGLAGWTYIAVGETAFMHRLLTVGSILGGISFMVAVCGAMVCSDTRTVVEDDDDDC